ncbi:type III-A CRISPR-associated protein Cas10/Csm1 [Neisseria musculi]|uniref:CRISPR system single-strand-specific deoxyribonuclease Cas10/Csm1 (subtype III-A) n=1 Tax=Neisseria musculi TaxID=1815583 RepID=A0A7H1MC10_9NEIS|nr:type III-A CRISPR-associated protein Cas10/Csm1 [Neisseria musculi]QNT59175.1 putative hydrolase-like protein [Neisseria musculi]
MLNSTAKVAFAAYLHDLGKFVERARLDVPDDELQTHVQLYCPRLFVDGKPGRQYTHKDVLEQHVPDWECGDMYPFADRAQVDKTDSLLHAAAMHHKPETFLQWIIATADRVASGFGRETFEHYNQSDDTAPANGNRQTGKNHYQTRLLTLFEQIAVHWQAESLDNADLDYCYPLKALSPESIFPQKRETGEPGDNQRAQAEYRDLWQKFLQALETIPVSHRQNWDLWLDHFDTLWQTYTHAIPAATAFGVKPEVSLYDHSKTTAALAAALWRWHEANGQTGDEAVQALKSRSDWDEQKILLIQGDFFGIQNFIFASGSQTNKRAAKLLRGRSFQVSLFAELAALKVLRACGLPSVSQILNAAGKFMIVAPNTADVRTAVETVKAEINAWFIRHSFGQVAMGLSVQAASCNDFTDKERFAELVKQSFAVLERAKLQRFNLTADTPAVLNADYSQCAAGSVCSYNQQLPAEIEADGRAAARLSQDQITLGNLLTKQNRILVLEKGGQVHSGGNTVKLRLPVFGLHIAFTAEDISGKFGTQAAEGTLWRFWDFSLPEQLGDHVWKGYARRYINAYVPHFSEADEWLNQKYSPVRGEDDQTEIEAGQPKTFNHLACEDRTSENRTSENGQQFIGKVAIAALKGDVDNLGTIFQKGLQAPTFAKMAALSRQVNHFFSLWLPAYCAEHYPNTYTVFAGGDDFFLIGPWLQTQKLAADMREAFGRYVAGNEEISFSAGIYITKPGLPLGGLSAGAEEALGSAKSLCHSQYGQKNSLCVYGTSVSWHEWHAIETAAARIGELKDAYGLSTGFIYDMLQFCEAAGRERNGDIAACMWHSRLAYRIRRHVDDNKKIISKNNAYAKLIEAFYKNGIKHLEAKYRIPLFNHFYLLRAK